MSKGQRSATGELLGELVERGMTQREIADSLGVSDRLVRHGLSGSKPLANLETAARALVDGDRTLAGQRAVLSRRTREDGSVAAVRGATGRGRPRPATIERTPAGAFVRGEGRAGLVALARAIVERRRAGDGGKVSLRISWVVGFHDDGSEASPDDPLDTEVGGKGGVSISPDTDHVTSGTPHELARILALWTMLFGRTEAKSARPNLGQRDPEDDDDDPDLAAEDAAALEDWIAENIDAGAVGGFTAHLR